MEPRNLLLRWLLSPPIGPLNSARASLYRVPVLWAASGAGLRVAQGAPSREVAVLELGLAAVA